MDIRQHVTDSVIAALENGVPPWRKGWHTTSAPFNASSGKQYQGINFLILQMQGRSDPRWITFKQATAMGLSVRKGEKATQIVKLVEVQRDIASEPPEVTERADEPRQRLAMKAYAVFNAEQVDGFAPLPNRDCSIEPAEAVMLMAEGLQQKEAGSLKVHFGGSQPAYYPRADEIRMPGPAAHLSAEEFHANLLHECIHATGHPKRLARLHMDAKFGTSEYAREELVAELGTCIALLAVSIRPSKTSLDNHAAYIASWLKLLRDDKSEIFRAAAHAQRAADYLCERAMRVQPPAGDHKHEEGGVRHAPSEPQPAVARISI